MKNKKDRIITAILLLSVLFALYSLVVYSSSELSVSAKAAVLYEPETESFLYTKNADQKLPMASTTKIMTALVALEKIPLDQKVTIAKEAVGIEGSSLYLKEDEILTMEDLVTALMLRSANDAAAAIAYAISGGIEPFAELMNERAKEMGLENTNFTNPHGLDDSMHYTTARELALISAEALRNAAFRKIVSTKTKRIINEDGYVRLVTNHNKLLSLYDGAIGVKTGFTKKSGRCLVGASDRNGLQFISVTINAPDDWNDHIELLNYGYSKLEKRHIANIGDFEYQIPVIGGESETVTVKNIKNFDYITEIGNCDIESHVKLSRYISAPIIENQILGKVIFTKDGTYIGQIDLVADEGVPKIKDKKFFNIF